MTAPVLDHTGAPVNSKSIAKIRANALSPMALSDSYYRGASHTSQDMAGWNTYPLSADAAGSHERGTLSDRAQDLIRNDGRAAAGLKKSAAMVIGAGWRLSARVDANTLGVDKNAAKSLNKILESFWKSWANDKHKCNDAERHLDFGGQINLLYRHWRADGDALAVLRFRKGGFRHKLMFGTCLQIIDPARLCNPSGRPDTDTLRGGIEFDSFGAATAYHIRDGHPGDYWAGSKNYTWTRIPRETSTGRPVVIHGYDKDRAGQSRGVSAFAPILRAFKMLGRYSEAELKTATLGAMFGAFITSGLDPESIAEVISSPGEIAEAVKSVQSSRMDFHEKHPTMMEGTRIVPLFPGDKVELNTTQRDSGGFEGFTKVFLQLIASSLEVSYPQLSQDWNISFSAARAALNDIWESVITRRAQFASQVVGPIYLAVTEEFIANNVEKLSEFIDDPLASFYRNPTAWCQADWVGPGRGSLDPVKDAQSAVMRIRSGQSSLPREVQQSSGADIEDIAREQAEAIEIFKDAGVHIDLDAKVTLKDDKNSTKDTGQNEDHPADLDEDIK